MDSQLTRQTDGLTTAAILSGCEEASVTVTKAQLSRWAALGFLSRPQRRGKGQGRGTIWLWSRDSIERAVVVAPVVRTGKNADIAVGRALVCAGHAVPAPLLRKVLHSYVDRLDETLSLRGYPHDDTNPAQRERWVLKAIRRRWPTLEDGFTRAAAALIVAMLDQSAPTSGPFRAMARYLGPAALRHAVTCADDATLTAAWGDVVRLVPLLTLVPAVFDGTFLVPFKIALNIGVAAGGAASDTALPLTLTPTILDRDTEASLRLLATVSAVSHHYYGDATVDAVKDDMCHLIDVMLRHDGAGTALFNAVLVHAGHLLSLPSKG